MSNNQAQLTETFYKQVISKVYEALKDEFQHEGIADDVLIEFKKSWYSKIMNSGNRNNFSHFGYDGNLQMGLNGYSLYPPMNYETREQMHYVNTTIPFKSNKNNTGKDNIALYLKRKEMIKNQQIVVGGNGLEFVHQELGHSQPVIGVPLVVNNALDKRVDSPNAVITNLASVQALPSAKAIANLEQMKTNGNGANEKKALPTIQEKNSINNISKNGNKNTTNLTDVPKNGMQEDENSVDSDRELFNEKLEVEEKKNSEEELSEMSNESENDGDAKDLLLAQYEKVHRVRNKWKINFLNAILNINGKEYVFEKVNGELERDW